MCIQYRRRAKHSSFSFPSPAPFAPFSPNTTAAKKTNPTTTADNNDVTQPAASVRSPSARKQKSSVFAMIRRRSSSSNSGEDEDFTIARIPQCNCRRHGACGGKNSSDDNKTMYDTATSSTSSSDSESSVSSAESPKERGVRFGKVHIREYELTVGDNPAVSEAPAMSLGWRYYTCTVCQSNTNDSWTVEAYEQMRQKQRNGRGPHRYSKAERLHILTSEFGVSKKEIQEASRKVIETQRRRDRTLGMVHGPTYFSVIDGELVLVEGDY